MNIDICQFPWFVHFWINQEIHSFFIIFWVAMSEIFTEHFLIKKQVQCSNIKIINYVTNLLFWVECITLKCEFYGVLLSPSSVKNQGGHKILFCLQFWGSCQKVDGCVLHTWTKVNTSNWPFKILSPLYVPKDRSTPVTLLLHWFT